MATTQGPLVHYQNAHNFPLVMLYTGSDTADLLALCAARFGTRYHAVGSCEGGGQGGPPAGDKASTPDIEISNSESKAAPPAGDRSAPLCALLLIFQHHSANSDEDYCCTAPYVDQETGKAGIVVAVNHRYHDARSAAVSVGWIDKKTAANTASPAPRQPSAYPDPYFSEVTPLSEPPLRATPTPMTPTPDHAVAGVSSLLSAHRASSLYDPTSACDPPPIDLESVVLLPPVTRVEQPGHVRADVASGVPLSKGGAQYAFLHLNSTEVAALKEQRGLTRNEVGFAVVCVAASHPDFVPADASTEEEADMNDDNEQTTSKVLPTDAAPLAWVLHTTRPRGDMARGDFSYVTTPMSVPTQVGAVPGALKAHLGSVKARERDWPDANTTMPPRAMMLDTWVRSGITHPLGPGKDCRFDLRAYLGLVAGFAAGFAIIADSSEPGDAEGLEIAVSGPCSDLRAAYWALLDA